MTHALFVRWRVRRLLQSCLSQHVKDRFRFQDCLRLHRPLSPADWLSPAPPAVAGGLAVAYPQPKGGE